MQLYRHRINRIEDLDALPPGVGLELDLRSDGPNILVAHDPFRDGLRMQDYFPHLAGRPLILNVKCEGITDDVLGCAADNGLEDFFFLGLGLSDTVRLVERGERRVANYYSEYHHPEEPLAWVGKVDWLWVDTFHHYPLHDAVWPKLAESFKLCIGSPELYGHPLDVQAELRRALDGRPFHAVCTKHPDRWGM